MSGAPSIDPAACEVLEQAKKRGWVTIFQRAEQIKPCPIGQGGGCCRICGMGPCRLVGEVQTGVCGATESTVVARNFARMVAAGAAAHSDHGRALALLLQEVARGEIPHHRIADERKLRWVAELMGVPAEGRPVEQVAAEVASRAIEDFTRQRGELTYISRAPKKRQEVWRAAGVVPRGIDREISEMMHRTTIGTDQEAEHLLDQAVRVALGSGWGGSMLATDLSDILFGTPSPLPAEANLGVLRAEAVNVVVHGHEPLLPEALVQVLAEPELQAEARAAGAEGINLVGMCCTGNEALMRRGIPSAGNFLHQELAILTGAVDAMVVDVQCILEALAALAKQFHTRLITTSPKARITGAEHLELSEERALEVAREIIRRAIAAYRERREEVAIPPHKAALIAGFSHEYIEYMLGGRYRRSFWPLVDNIINGRLLGVAAVVGCNNPRIPQDSSSLYAIKELIANNVLVVTTGCTAVAAGKHGLLDPAMLELAGPGLREVCEAVGIGPVLHLGSCVDNSRVLTVLSALVATGGLGSDISDLPAVGLCPEWMSEKALEIGTYFAGSGATVLFGGVSPVSGSRAVVEIMTERWQARYGGRLEFVGDPAVLVSKALETLHRKRQALGIDVQRQRVLFDMDSRRQLA